MPASAARALDLLLMDDCMTENLIASQGERIVVP
jgi:hypothetical protein